MYPFNVTSVTLRAPPFSPATLHFSNTQLRTHLVFDSQNTVSSRPSFSITEFSSFVSSLSDDEYRDICAAEGLDHAYWASTSVCQETCNHLHADLAYSAACRSFCEHTHDDFPCSSSRVAALEAENASLRSQLQQAQAASLPANKTAFPTHLLYKTHQVMTTFQVYLGADYLSYRHNTWPDWKYIR